MDEEPETAKSSASIIIIVLGIILALTLAVCLIMSGRPNKHRDNFVTYLYPTRGTYGYLQLRVEVNGDPASYINQIKTAIEYQNQNNTNLIGQPYIITLIHDIPFKWINKS